MKLFLIVVLTFFILNPTFAQDERSSVYKVRPWVEFPLSAGGFVANYFGVRKLKSKPGIDSLTAMRLSPADVNRFDRGASKQNPAVAQSMMTISDISLTSTVLLPSLLFINKNIRHDFGSVGLVYFETMSIMSNAYSWGVGNINRKRPYVFNIRESLKRRTRLGSFNSFYAGHVAAAACATVFMVKVITDYYPDMQGKGWLFGAAMVPPVFIGYLRYRSGMHFPSDIIAGLAFGSFLGYIVPHLHKQKKKNANFSLEAAPGYGLVMTYKFR